MSFTKLLVLALLACTTADAAFVNPKNSVTCDGVTRHYSRKLEIYHSTIISASNHAIFLKSKGAADAPAFRPDSGKKFCIVGAVTTTAGYLCKLLTGTADPNTTGYENAGAPTGAYYQGQRSGSVTASPGYIYYTTSYESGYRCTQHEQLASEYLFSYCPSGTGTVTVVGYQATECDE